MAFDESQLSVGVVVDVSALGPATTQVSAQVEQMASKIKTAFGSVARAPEQVQLAFQMLNAELARTTPNAANVASMMAAVDDSLKLTAAGAQQAGAQIEQAMVRTTRSVTEARLGAQLLGQEMGIRFPRALSTILARSETMGPVLNAAFGTIAVVGFIEMAVLAADKIKNLIEEIFIFSEAEKAVYAQLVKDNEAILKISHEINAALRANALIGLSGAAAEKLRVEFNEKDAATLKASIAGQQAKLTILKEQYAVAQKQSEAAVQTAIAVPEEPLSAAVSINAADNAMRKLQAEIDSTASSIGVAQKQLQLLGVEGTGLGKKMGVDQATEAAEAWKKANQQMVQGFKDRAAIQKETGQALAAVMTEQFQTELEAGKRETESYLVGLKEREKGLQESAKRRIEEEKKVADETLKSSIETAKLAMEQNDARLEHEFKMAQINEQQLLALKKKALADEFAAEQAALEKRLSGLSSYDPDYPAQRKKIYDELLALQQKYNLQSTKLDQTMAETRKKEWSSIFSEINRPLDTMVQGVLLGTQRVGVAFQRMGANMLISVIESFIKQRLVALEESLFETVLQKSAIAQRIADFVTGTAAKKTVEITANVASVQGSAGTGGAAAFASVIEALPFPANVAAAPAVAAATIAQIESLGAIALFAKGGISPRDDTIAMFSREEMVLPPDISRGLQGAIRGGSVGAGGGGEAHVHLHIHALDAKDMQDWISRGGGDQINRHLRKTFRGMGMTPRLSGPEEKTNEL